jgi:hypothetical protein
VKKGDIVCFKGDRSAIATVTMVRPYGYMVSHLGADHHGLKASLIWLTGPKMGTKREHDTRDLIMVEETE